MFGGFIISLLADSFSQQLDEIKERRSRTLLASVPLDSELLRPWNSRRARPTLLL